MRNMYIKIIEAEETTKAKLLKSLKKKGDKVIGKHELDFTNITITITDKMEKMYTPFADTLTFSFNIGRMISKEGVHE